jgi:ATP-dependent helicase HepA
MVLFKGMLVELPRGLGVGKLESVSDGRCSISAFHSILRTETFDLALSVLRRAFLSPQTRVYVKQDDKFEVGRITSYLKQDNGLIDYEVRFPNGRQEDFSELDLYVRLWNAPEDPAEILAAGGGESQFLHDHRQSALLPLLKLRSAAQGLTSLLSAGIDFVPHQIAAVRRVLTDPIQRYLLADEVGLGKTIEAGLIIRQHLIDNPNVGVLIATPTHLCEQWRSELVNKLKLDQFDAAFECCSHADLARVSRMPDILVVDEAHHLVGIESGPLAKAANRLVEIAHKTPILLLLSATPALSNEGKFLALLNLLDPLTHPLSDLDGFREKLQQRREFGRLLLSLDPKSPGLVIRKRSAEIQKLFPNDRIVAELAPRLIEASQHGTIDLEPVCNALKEHIADSYRIHQRLIRSRRADAKGWEFMPRGPAVNGVPILSHVRIEVDPDDNLAAIAAGLEDWRFSAIEAAHGNAALHWQYATRYARLLESFSVSNAAFFTETNPADALFNDEEEILESLRALITDNDESRRIALMVESTKRLLKTLSADTRNPKVVVFAPSVDVATSFHAAFHGGCEGVVTFLFVEDGESDETQAASAFVNLDATAVLVMDRCGEEGLNLNCADAIVHLDLPLSAARLEQRIGRLDRFGRRQSVIRHRILLPYDDDASPWLAWFSFLANGFLIFNRSISDVQFLLDDIESQGLITLFEKGPDALVALSEEIRQRIAEERRSQDEQYALDRIALAEEPVEEFIQTLEDAEEDEQALEHGVNQWLIGGLQLKKRPYAWPEEDPFKLVADHNTLIPRLPWLSAFGIEDLKPLTWRRRVATKRPETTLLRPGTPLIDVTERFMRWDDRGTAFVTWRKAHEWIGDPWVGFRLCFVVEPNIEMTDMLAPTSRELALARRAQRYFAPYSEIIHVDVNGDIVEDPKLLSILHRPYRPYRKGADATDINLGSRPHLLEQIIDAASFQRCCRLVRDSARAMLRTQPEFTERSFAAGKAVHADLDRHRNREFRDELGENSFTKADAAIIEEILPGVINPTIRLDAMGCFVIAGFNPSVEHE